MGDISEMRGLVVVVSFLAVFFIIASLIPSGLLQSSSSPQANRGITPNEGLNAYRMLGWNNSKDITILSGGNANETQVKGYNVYMSTSSGVIDPVILGETYASWWIIVWDVDYFKWYLQNGTDVSNYLINPRIAISMLDALYAENYSMVFSLVNSHVSLTGAFTWNTGTYAKPSDAYAVDALHLGFETSFDDTGSSINAWNLLTSILFFQYIPSVPIYMSAMIAVPIWVCIGYLVFIFILRMIGVVFGGGGA